MRVSIEIEPEWQEFKIKSGCSWKEILGFGILAKQDHPQLTDRLRRIEERIGKCERYILQNR